MYLILVAALLAAAFGLLSRVYSRNWDKKLDVTIKITNDGIFEGEKGEITETVSNNKLMPIFWAYLQFRVPGPLCFDDSDAGHDTYRQDRVSVFSYEEVTKRLCFTAARRGCYRLSDLQFVAGDLRFNYKMMKGFPASPEIYVYPRAKETERFKIDSDKIIGEVIARRSYVEDPFFFRGIRDYYPFDSMKNVNWKATARTGSLKVNQYHTTQSQQVLLLLDLDGYNQLDGQQIKEDAISVAAFLARKLALSGIAAGFATNAADSVTGGGIRTECKSGRGHFFTMMREMAKIDTGSLLMPFDRILKDLARSGDPRTQYILISYYYGAGLVRRMEKMEASGRNIQWIFLNDSSRRIDFVRRPGMYVCEEVRG